MKRSWKIIVIGVFVIFVAGNALAATCKPVTGRISPLSVCPGDDLQHPTCYQGTSTGNFSGSFESHLTSGTLLDAATVAFTAATTLVTNKGTITFYDTGVTTLLSGIPATAEVLTIIPADQNAPYGQVFITGNYVPVPGTRTGLDYGYLSGQICLP